MTYAPITLSTVFVWLIATAPIWLALAIIAARPSPRGDNDRNFKEDDMKTWTETRDALITAGIPGDRLPAKYQWRINLFGADLRGADLREANLTGANLSGADLRGANLTGAEGPFTHGYFGRHHAVAAGGYISIGSERHAYEWWLNNHQKCGSRHWYTADEIADYGAWIELAVARQRRIETTPPAA